MTKPPPSFSAEAVRSNPGAAAGAAAEQVERTARLQPEGGSPAAEHGEHEESSVSRNVERGLMVFSLAIAIFGPRRFQQEIVRPVRTAVSDQAEKLWSEARPLRAQLGSLIERAASETGREKLIRNFQSWIGHFKAT